MSTYASLRVSSSPSRGLLISGSCIISHPCSFCTRSPIIITRRARCLHSSLLRLTVLTASRIIVMRPPASTPVSCATVATWPRPFQSAMATLPPSPSESPSAKYLALRWNLQHKPEAELDTTKNCGVLSQPPAQIILNTDKTERKGKESAIGPPFSFSKDFTL